MIRKHPILTSFDPRFFGKAGAIGGLEIRILRLAAYLQNRTLRYNCVRKLEVWERVNSIFTDINNKAECPRRTIGLKNCSDLISKKKLLCLGLFFFGCFTLFAFLFFGFGFFASFLLLDLHFLESHQF